MSIGSFGSGANGGNVTSLFARGAKCASNFVGDSIARNGDVLTRGTCLTFVAHAGVRIFGTRTFLSDVLSFAA